MKKELTTEELRKYPLISLPLRRQKYDEVIKRIETAYNEGKTVDRTIEELVQGVIVRIIDKQDVIDYYKERDREKQIKEIKERSNEETTEEETNKQNGVAYQEETKPEQEIVEEKEENFQDYSDEIEKLEKELPNDDEEVIPNRTVSDITKTAKAILERQNLKEKTNNNSVEMEIADEDLEDWEKQDFPMYDEEEKEAMKNSLIVHGIIEKLVVRPIKEKPRKIPNFIWS